MPGSRFVTAFLEDSWGLSKRLANFTVETVVEPLSEGTRVRLNAYYQPRTVFMILLNRCGLRRLMAKQAFLVLTGIKHLAEEAASAKIATDHDMTHMSPRWQRQCPPLPISPDT